MSHRFCSVNNMTSEVKNYVYNMKLNLICIINCTTNKKTLKPKICGLTTFDV